MSVDQSVSRIYANGDRVVGAGFLIAGDKVLTCAHVVTTALNLGEPPLTPPKGELGLDFPLVSAGKIQSGHIRYWLPREDIAVLELDVAAPGGVEPVQFVEADDVWGHQLRVFGFPVNYQMGVWASGQALGPNALVQPGRNHSGV